MTAAAATLPPHLRQYRANGAWRDQTIAEYARAWAEAEPGAVVFPNDAARPTYATLWTDAEALAVALTDLGLRRGDVIAFQLFNWVEAAVINLAAAIAGFVVNPIVPIYRDAEVRHMLHDSRAAAYFYAGEFPRGAGRGFDFGAMISRLRGDLPGLAHVIGVRGEAPLCYAHLVAAGRGQTGNFRRGDPDQVKLLLYTSGTTGLPKAVLHSHNTLGRVEDVSCGYWGIGAGDVLLMPSPVTHISGYANGLELPFRAGTRTLLMESWNADAAVDLIETHRAAGTIAATPFLKELASVSRARGTKLPGLRIFACGGASVPADLVRDANAAFAQPCAFRVFGASEVPLVTLGFAPDRFPEQAAATDGKVVDYEVRIEDDDGSSLEAGGEGEILVRGPSMFLGYADAAETRASLTAEGYFRTGDLGSLSAEGALLVTGRKKDLIIRGGENISAREIEDVLLRHPGVRDVAVVAMPHPRLGEGVCAFVVPREPAPDATMLIAHVAASGLARQKCPERIEFVAALPSTPSGKPRKDVLRAQIRALLQAT
jgi:acyl-CoA synthetase (AMP-forming)/AMP-acid ligase II